MIKDFLRHPAVLFISRLILGVVFIYASYDKALNPMAFAKIIWHYRITPPDLINIAAVILPWIELLTGVLIIIGYKVRGANLILSGLLVFYIVLLTITAVRGINVNCGCFSTSPTVKSNLIIRIIEDVGMLILGVHILAFYKTKKRIVI